MKIKKITIKNKVKKEKKKLKKKLKKLKKKKKLRTLWVRRKKIKLILYWENLRCKIIFFHSSS